MRDGLCKKRISIFLIVLLVLNQATALVSAAEEQPMAVTETIGDDIYVSNCLENKATGSNRQDGLATGSDAHETVIINSFSSLEEEIAYQTYEVSSIDGLHNMLFPAMLEVIDENGNEFLAGTVSWECFSPVTGFDQDVIGIYKFEAILPEHYEMGEDSEFAPVITVEIHEAELLPTIMTLSVEQNELPDLKLFEQQFPISQVFDCQRSPAFPQVGQSIDLTRLTAPYKDGLMGAEVDPDEYRDGYFAFSWADDATEEDLRLKLSYYTDGKEPEVFAESGYMYGMFDNGFLYVSGYGYLILFDDLETDKVRYENAQHGRVDEIELMDEYIERIEEQRLDLISIKTPPLKTAYIEGEYFDKSGMVINVLYNNAMEKDIISGYEVTPSGALALDIDYVTISYTVGETTRITTCPITVEEKVFTEINVKTSPVKTTYIEGENFDSSGLIMSISYNNGTTEEITGGYEVNPSGALTLDTEYVTISYTVGETTRITTCPITVEEKVFTEINVKTPPVKTIYIEGENFDSSGLVMSISYNDGTTEEITSGYEVIPTGSLALGMEAVTIKYTVDGITRTTIQPITVEPRPEVRYVVEVFANPSNGGIVTGSGSYMEGTMQTVTATANADYQFEYWSEGTLVVSDDAEYTFAITDHRTLTANFSYIGTPDVEKRDDSDSDGYYDSNQWEQDASGNWRYYNKTGAYARNEWCYLSYNGTMNWYYFGNDGFIHTGWFLDQDNNWYYLNPVSDGSKGAMKSGWQQIDGIWYYFNEGGSDIPLGRLEKDKSR